jgi:hypothetical protein
MRGLSGVLLTIFAGADKDNLQPASRKKAEPFDPVQDNDNGKNAT